MQLIKESSLFQGIEIYSINKQINLFLLLTLILLCSITVGAQDVIIKKDGNEIEAKIQEINKETIKYKRFDMQDGPVYEIEKSAVFMIKYPTGQKDVFNETAPVKEEKASYKNSSKPDVKLQKNAIGLNPLLFIINLDTKWGHVEYEKLIGDRLSIGGRIIRAEQNLSDYWEESTGAGIFIRKYFNGGSGLKGFYIGSDLDVLVIEWGEWWGTVGDSTYELGKGTAIAFTSQIGFKINIGKALYFDPSIALGYYKSFTSSSYNDYIETGVVAAPALTIGFKF